MKRGRTSPWAKSSAIHCASLTSVLRPGAALLCAAFSSHTSNTPSSSLKTGFQNSPALSPTLEPDMAAAAFGHPVSAAQQLAGGGAKRLSLHLSHAGVVACQAAGH